MDVFSTFGLNFKQTCLLFSLERQIIMNDITYSEMQNKVEEANAKKAWLYNWESKINDYLSSLNNGQSLSLGVDTIDPKSLFIKEKENSKNLTWKYLILLECILFNPYYPLEMVEDKGVWEALKEKFKNQALNKDNKIYSLNKIAEILEIENTYVEKFKKSYEASLDTLSGFWQKIVLGVGIGAIATTIIVLCFINPIAGGILAVKGITGLTGIAAFNAAMAALGGGAIAAGGLGVAGGIAVLVGGSLVLGGGTGAVIGMLTTNPKIMMTEMAKMQVVMKEIVLGLQKDTALFQEILNKLTANELEMRQEIKRLQEDNEANKEKIKNLQEAVEYLEKGINELKK